MLTPLLKKAKDIGFIAAGFSKAEKPIFFDQFITRISQGKHADMTWLERHRDVREKPSRLLEGCRTIVSLAYPYFSDKPCTPDGYSVSRYSQPSENDYHDRLKALCRPLADMIGDMHKGARTRICVDSAPILERSYAYSAGLGFIGKNNMLIIPGQGSYFYLAEMLTTANLAFEAPDRVMIQCGECMQCIEACPTGALEEPFSIDASKCLSYLTIESQDEIETQTGHLMGNCFFGCDRCQEACPFNKGADTCDVILPETEKFLTMNEKEFKERYGKSSLARAGLRKLKSNLRAIIAKPS